MTTTTNPNSASLPITKNPSSRLWAAALSGLVGLSGGCGGSPTAQVDPDGAAPDAPTAMDKVISEIEGYHTFAELTAMCDQRGGYTQVTASCAGMNSCAGFSYGDWDPGVLTEHSCNAANGCNGMSCVVLPPDAGKQPMDILSAPEVEGQPPPCGNCHADWSGDTPDYTTFKVWVLPDSTRTLANWLDVPASAQARTIAFGKVGQYADGSAYRHMEGYHKLYSRAEIERLVLHVRTQAKIAIEKIKVADAPKPALQRATRMPSRRGR